MPRSIHHISRRIRFELCRVRSPLLTTSRLVSSPAPTKMFQFGAFPFRWRNDAHASGCPIRESLVQWLHAPTQSLSQLGTPFVGTRTEPSTDRRKNVFVVSSNPCNVQKRLVYLSYCSSTQRIIAPVSRGLKPFPGSVARPGASKKHQWTRGDLNPRPRRCKRRALPTELRAL